VRPTFFDSPAAFRAWLVEHHAEVPELWVGFYKKGSGRGGIGYQEAVDEALCFGWIDGVKRRVDEASYMHRFTPRRKGSRWSTGNVRRVGELAAAGRMAAAGLAAFEVRDPDRPAGYSYESRPAALDSELEESFRAHAAAWEFFSSQPPGYRRTITFWVMSATQEATRRRRLERVIAASAAETRLR
jgi:uncharacterized protein YdeI (YjbR/CyaY-like superfamily)